MAEFDDCDIPENIRIQAALLAALPEDPKIRIAHLAGAIGVIALAEGLDEAAALDMARSGIRAVASQLILREGLN